MSAADALSTLLATFDSSTPSLTLFRIAPAVRLIGPPVDGVAALLVLSGTLHLDVGGEARRVVRAGGLALLPPGRPARIAGSAEEPRMTLDGRQCLTQRDGWLVVEATRGAEPALVLAAGRIAGSHASTLSHGVVTAMPDDRIARPLFALLRAEIERGAQGHPALASALMNACVVQGLRRAIAREPGHVAGHVPERSLVARAIAAIRSRPGEAHSVDSLARVAGMSRSTFIRHFKRATRQGPSEYVQQVRLEEARTLLQTTPLPVKTVAANTGFASRSHFSRAFRAAFGRDPSAYRRDGEPPAP